MFRLVLLFFMSSAQHMTQTNPTVLHEFCTAWATDTVWSSSSLHECDSSFFCFTLQVSVGLASTATPTGPSTVILQQSLSASVSISVFHVHVYVCVFVCECQCGCGWLRTALGVALVFFLVWDSVSCLPLDPSGWLAFDLLWFSLLLPPCCRDYMMHHIIIWL